MKLLKICPAVFALFLLLLLPWLLPEAALAHRVNVFAFVDGGAIQVECSFGRSQPVRQGRLLITDLESGALVHEGITDEQGRYRFRPPEEFLASGHGLNLRLVAGEGHQDDWQLEGEELQGIGPAGASGASGGQPSAAPAAAPFVVPGASGSRELYGQPDPSGQLDQAGLEETIGRLLDAKLAPLKQALARQSEPGLRDIIGGLGWIIGLLGLAAYLKHRR